MACTRTLGLRALMTISFLALSIPSTAQSLTYGARGGLGLSRVVFSDDFAEDTPTSPGLVGGGFLGWKIRGPIAVGAEGLVVSQHVTIADSIKDSFLFLDVPLLVRYDVLTVGGHRITACGGYVYRYRIDATEESAGESFPIKEGTEDSGSALAIGADVQIRRQLSAGVRYQHGRTGVYKRIGGGTAGRDRTVQVTLEWRLR